MKGLRWMGWRKDKDRRDSFLWETAVQLPDKLQLKIPNQTRMLTIGRKKRCQELQQVELTPSI